MRNDFEIISVNYNTPDLIDRLINSIRKNYAIPIRIIDGSDTEETKRLAREVCGDYSNVTIEQLGYNIHHGRGLDYGISSSTLDWCMCIDSDCEILNGMFECFKFTHAIEGFACWVNEYGMNVEKGKGILYLHPEILLVDVEKYKQSPYKIKKHGAPCIDVMRYTSDNEKLIISDEYRVLYKRGGRGTVNRFGYNL